MTVRLTGLFPLGGESDARPLPDSPPEISLRRLSSGRGAVSGGLPDDLFHEDPERGVVVAMAGRPAVASDSLARVAAERGLAAAIAEGVAREGSRVFAGLDGGFACLVVDARRGRVMVVLDRMGIRQLAYGVGEGFLAIGEAPGDVARLLGCHGRLDEQSIYGYLYHHMVPGPRSIHRGVSKLPPATVMEWDLASGRRQVSHYWQPSFSRAEVGESVLQERLRNELAASVEAQIGEGGRIGAFLSGGLDSSTVAGLMARRLGEGARAFSIGFDAEGFDEIPFAKMAAERFGLDHVIYYLERQDVIDAIPRIVEAYDEPFGNSSAVPVYHCARVARENGVTSLLAGDGGDELFAGNSRYRTQLLFDLYERLPSLLRKGVIEPLLLGPGLDRRNIPLIRKVARYVVQARVPLPDRLESYNTFHMTPPEEILHPEFLARIDVEGPLEGNRQVWNEPEGADTLDRMLYLDWRRTLAENDLRKVDTMCRVAGVEVRYPMLGNRVVELSTSIPSSLKLTRGELRRFYKQAFRELLPEGIINKKKHGFGLPFGVWMKEWAPLRELAYDSLDTLKRREIVRADYLDELVETHRHGHAWFYGEQIWVLMMLELWLARHADEA